MGMNVMERCCLMCFVLEKEGVASSTIVTCWTMYEEQGLLMRPHLDSYCFEFKDLMSGDCKHSERQATQSFANVCFNGKNTHPTPLPRFLADTAGRSASHDASCSCCHVSQQQSLERGTNRQLISRAREESVRPIYRARSHALPSHEHPHDFRCPHRSRSFL